MRHSKSFIVTPHVILIRVHFSALIIDTPATLGPTTPTKHGWPFQFLYRALAMTPKIPKIFAVFPYLGTIKTHKQNKNFDHTK